MGTLAAIIGAGILAIVVIAGLWRATSPQKGTGCPCCDKHLSGEGHDHDHDHEHNHDHNHDHDHDHKHEHDHDHNHDHKHDEEK